MSTAKKAAWAYLNLAVLWTFAVAQPLFDLLGDNPEFFAARGSSGWDIISFSVLLVILPPAAMLAVEMLLGLIGEPVRIAVHTFFIGALVALIAAQALKKAFDGSDGLLIVLSLVVGAGVAALWLRTEGVRSFLNILSPAPLVFLLLFLLGSPVSKLAFPDEADARTVGGVTRAPIVMVLFDELPVTSIEDDRGRIDAERFPGFGKLAEKATWFPNAYAVYDSTERAQPAIMDGNYPSKDKLPTSSDHPNSIFSLFGKTHTMHVSEEATTVCSRDLCEDERLEESYGSRMSSMTEDLGLVWLHVVSPPGIERDLASVSENWGNFGGGEETETETAEAPEEDANVRGNLNRNRDDRWIEWIDEIRGGGRPQLDFKHTLLPHVPWQYLPDGRLYRRTASDVISGLSSQSFEHPGQLESLQQRHLLQTGFADLQLQRLWRKLEDEGIYDDALIVVAADHGVAFREGERDRRRLKRENAPDIASIPLLIKAPGQEKGKIDDAYVETVDILPTMLDVLGVDPRVKQDGKSAFSPEVQQRDTIRILERGTFEPLEFPADEWERRQQALLDKQVRLFGTGADGPDRIWRIGPNQELLGRQVTDAPAGDVEAELVNGGDYRSVDPESSFIPAHVIAELSGGEEGETRDVAIAVNGRIAAVSRSFSLATDSGQELVAAMVPPSSLKAGRNSVGIYEVGAGGDLTRLGGV
jgi:sulfatase-like protein